MTNIIDFNKNKISKEITDLVQLGIEYDELSLKFLYKGADIKDVAGIMANRLGELVRIFDGDQKALKEMLYGIIETRSNL